MELKSLTLDPVAMNMKEVSPFDEVNYNILYNIYSI